MKRSLVLLLAAASLTGCGQDDADDAAAPDAGNRLEIVETEFALDPADVSVDTAGETTIRVVNDGQFPHAHEIEGNGIKEETEELGPGESAELTVDLENGGYELYCPIGDHRQQGMDGTLIVGAGGAGSTDTGETKTDETETSEDDGYYTP